METKALYYSRELTFPKTKKEGLMNFVQMIVNAAESGQTESAMLKAVDLLHDLQCGVYDNALGISEEHAKSNLADMLDAENKKAQALAIAEYNRGFVEGGQAKAAQIKKALGLVE